MISEAQALAEGQPPLQGEMVEWGMWGIDLPDGTPLFTIGWNQDEIVWEEREKQIEEAYWEKVQRQARIAEMAAYHEPNLEAMRDPQFDGVSYFDT